MKENKKYFLYVGGFQLPDKNAAAHRVLGVAKILDKLGYGVVFLDVDSDRPEYTLSDMHMKAEFPTYSQKRPEGTKQWARYVLNPLYVEAILEKYDNCIGVIAYNYPAIALWKLKKICNKRNIKVYSDCTEWYQYGIFKSLRDIALVFDTFLRMRIVQKKLDGLIVISKYLERYYKKHLPVVVIPPLVDKEEEKWGKKPAVMKREEIRISYAGSPGKSKDKMDVIIRAVCKSSNSNLKLMVVGITKEEYLKYYPEDEALIETPEAADRIEFKGRVAHLEAIRIVKESDYTVFYRNISKVSMAGFPTKFVESISCGVPVITNETSDLKNYLKAGKNGILLNTECFEKELLQLFNSLSLEKREIIKVEEDFFEYRNYMNQIENWLEKCK